MNPTKPAAWRSFCPQFNRGLTFRLVLNLGKGHRLRWASSQSRFMNMQNSGYFIIINFALMGRSLPRQ